MTPMQAKDTNIIVNMIINRIISMLALAKISKAMFNFAEN
jgi:hypothetical protein